MEFFDVVAARHSIRAFTAEPVAGELVDQIVAAANRSPSAGNLQAYEICKVTDRGVLADLAQASYGQPHVAQAQVALVFCTHAERAAKYGTRGTDLYSIQDATIACAYAQLAVAALGLGSVWIGAFNEAQAAQVLCLPAGWRPVAILPIGHPAEQPADRPRRPIDDVVHPAPVLG